MQKEYIRSMLDILWNIQQDIRYICMDIAQQNGEEMYVWVW